MLPVTTSHHGRHEAQTASDPCPRLVLPGHLTVHACTGALFIDSEPGSAVQLSILLTSASARDLRDFLNEHYGDQRG